MVVNCIVGGEGQIYELSQIGIWECPLCLPGRGVRLTWEKGAGELHVTLSQLSRDDRETVWMEVHLAGALRVV